MRRRSSCLPSACCRSARHQIESPKRAPKGSAQGRLAVNSRPLVVQIFARLSVSFRQSGGAPSGGRHAARMAAKQQPRSARGAAALLACGPTKKPGKARRPAKHASPEKRLYAGKATTSIGLASSLDRNYRRCVGACERRQGTVFTGPGALRFSPRGHRRRERGAPEGAGLGEEA